MKLIYVAGPYRAKSEWELIENIRRAEAVAIEIWKHGMVAYCPHKNTAHFGGLCPDEVWLEGGLEVLKRCDGVVMVPDWGHSHGAVAEYEYAEKLGIPIYLWAKDIPK